MADVRNRAPAVAGLFYPENPVELTAEVEQHLAQAQTGAAGAPKALIVPHAGYVYSGPIAASAYALLRSGAREIRRVVLLGPALIRILRTFS